MISQTELIPLKPGDILRHEREQKGLTIELASRQSRINVSVLTAIESGDTSEIPSVYLHGYIKNYARFLGVDPAEIEDRLEHVQGAEPDVRSVFTVKTNRGNAEKWIKASSYLVASALIATLAWQFTHEAVRFSQGDSQLVSASAVTAENQDGDADESGSAGRPANTHLNASIASVEVLKKRSELTGDSAAEQAWAAIGGPAADSPGEAARRHLLAVSTSADTWVEISDADGKQLEMDLVRAGSNREYQGTAPFKVMIGRASAVEMVMDGETVDLGPYTRGNVARMTLDPQ
jgi:cytoskeleton protein RodZ